MSLSLSGVLSLGDDLLDQFSGSDVDYGAREEAAEAQLSGTSECPDGQYSASGVGRVASQMSRNDVEEAMRRYEDCRGEIAWDPGSTSIGSAIYFGETITSKREAGVALASLANGGPDCGSGGSIGGGGGEAGSSCAAQAVEWLLARAQEQGIISASGSNVTSSGGTPQSPGGEGSTSSGTTSSDGDSPSEVERIAASIFGPLLDEINRTGERAERAVAGAGAGAEAGARSVGLPLDPQTLLLAGGVVLAVVFAARR